jgi:iron complex transport system substrate-binding protein
MRFIIACLLCTVSVFLASPHAESVSDAWGRHVDVPDKSTRIVCLSPSVTEILFAIGAGDAVVGVTLYCDYPLEATSRTKVGGFSGATVSVEQIVALHSDLVIVSADMHERISALLSNLGVCTFAVEPRTFADVYETIATLGKLTGHAGEAQAVIKLMQEKIAAVQRRIAGTVRPTVFWELYDNPLMTAGRMTWVNEAIELAGGQNIFNDRAEQWPAISVEHVLMRKPEWILTGSDHEAALEQIPMRAVWRSIPAVQKRQISVIPADYVYRYGPRLVDAVEAIAALLHP